MRRLRFHLANLIEKIRSLPIDPIIVRKNWLQAYDYATARAANTLNEYARENDPFSRIGEQTTAIEVTSVVRASEKSFQIRWLERRYVNGFAHEHRSLDSACKRLRWTHRVML